MQEIGEGEKSNMKLGEKNVSYRRSQLEKQKTTLPARLLILDFSHCIASMQTKLMKTERIAKFKKHTNVYEFLLSVLPVY